MGVRGTVFFVKADPGKPILFCPCHGEIEVTALDSKSEVKFKSEHHDNPKLISGGTLAMKERMVDIPKDYDIDHSDGEIADLQALLKN